MHENRTDTATDPAPEIPKWLIFVNREPDDGPWLRMMVTNPLNGEMSVFVNPLITGDPPDSPS